MLRVLLILPLISAPALAQEELVARWLQEQGAAYPSALEVLNDLSPTGAQGIVALERGLGARLNHPAWRTVLAQLPAQAALKMQSDPSEELRAFGLLAGHRHGDSSCLGALVSLSAITKNRATAESYRVGILLADALAAIFRRDPRALPKLRLSAIPRQHLPPLADRLGRLPDPRALGVLVEMMDGDANLEQAVLTAVARLARTHVLEPRDAHLRRVRYRLQHPQGNLRMLACQALGWLYDEESVPALQERLSDPSPSVRSAAHTSLRRITGLRLPAGAAAWDSWISSQEDWWHERSQLVLQGLPTAEGAKRAGFLRELAGARLHRRALTRELLLLLERCQAKDMDLLLAAIVALDSPSALPAITRLLGHANAEVRAAASEALTSLQGPRAAPRSPKRTS